MDYARSLKIINETIQKWLDDFIAFIPNIIMAMIVLTVCYFLTRTVRRIAWNIFNKAFPNHNNYFTAVNIAVTCIFWFFAVFLALNILHLTSFLTHLLAGAGIVGIVAGFALNDVSSNAFAGLLIHTQRPFVVGDWVKIDNYFGTVEKIGLVGTSVQTYEGYMAYIPNQLMFSNSFLNYSTYGKVKIIVKIGVSYGDDLEHVERVALDTVEKLPMIILSELRDFYFVNIGSSTYNFQVRFWVKFHQHIDMLAAESAAIKALKKAFERENISVAYNVTTLDFGVKGGVNLYDKAIKIAESGAAGDDAVKAAAVPVIEDDEAPAGAKNIEGNDGPAPRDVNPNIDGTVTLGNEIKKEAENAKDAAAEGGAENPSQENQQLQANNRAFIARKIAEGKVATEDEEQEPSNKI